MPTIFGLVIISQSLIMQAEQKNPSEVTKRRLKERREEALIEIRMGNKTKGILDLTVVMKETSDILSNNIPCPHCKESTPRNEQNCINCGKRITIGGDQIGGNSSSYLNSFTTSN